MRPMRDFARMGFRTEVSRVDDGYRIRIFGGV
jgi:hypothetical protein